MRTIFLWFYCLPIGDAILLMLAATVCYLLLREKFRHMSWWKTGILLLFLVWILVILFGTLVQRTEGSKPGEAILTPFASYYAALNGGSKELYRTNFMIVVLFYPAGLLGCQLLPKGWRGYQKILLMAGMLGLISMGIEFAQYHLELGLAETDDIIHNAFGAILGAAACMAKAVPPSKIIRFPSEDETAN